MGVCIRCTSCVDQYPQFDLIIRVQITKRGAASFQKTVIPDSIFDSVGIRS